MNLTDINVPFGQLERHVQIKMVEHVLNGGKTEHRDGNGPWVYNKDVYERKLLCFVNNRTYRAKID